MIEARQSQRWMKTTIFKNRRCGHRRNDDRPVGFILIEGPLADIARRAQGGFCAALTSFGSAVTEESWFSNYFSVSLESIVENCKLSIAFATCLGSDEICRLSW